jgi:hypothetical protein
MDRRTAKDEKGSFHGISSIAAASIPEEPGAGKSPAGACPELVEGICAGAVGQLAVLPRWRQLWVKGVLCSSR